MARIRFSALEQMSGRTAVERGKKQRVSDIYGADVLTLEKMRHYLSVEAFKKLEK